MEQSVPATRLPLRPSIHYDGNQAARVAVRVREMAHWTENAASYEKTLRNSFMWLECLRLDPECKQLIRLAFKDDEDGMICYQEVILGIEHRWDAVMKRRSEPKRMAWKVEIIADLPKN